MVYAWFRQAGSGIDAMSTISLGVSNPHSSLASALVSQIRTHLFVVDETISQTLHLHVCIAMLRGCLPSRSTSISFERYGLTGAHAGNSYETMLKQRLIYV